MSHLIIGRCDRRLITLIAALTITVSCATASRTSNRTARAENTLTQEALAESAELTLYDAIQRLRPRWLRARGNNSMREGPAPVIVYVNNIRVGEVGHLRDIPVEIVREASYINAADATIRWGTDVSGGVIMVITSTG